MPTKKKSFIDMDLDWAEEQLADWKAYVDANPIAKLKDRTIPNGKGGILVVANIEQQGKYIQELLKNYLLLLEHVDKLREKQAEKVETRGDKPVGLLAEDFIKERDTKNAS